eukprot:PhF_6_TR41643/c0_g1_i3/m.63122
MRSLELFLKRLFPIFGTQNQTSLFSYDRTVRKYLDLPAWEDLSYNYLVARVEAFMYWIDPTIMETIMGLLIILLIFLVSLEVYDFLSVRVFSRKQTAKDIPIVGTMELVVTDDEAALRGVVQQAEAVLGMTVRHWVHVVGPEKENVVGFTSTLPYEGVGCCVLQRKVLLLMVQTREHFMSSGSVWDCGTQTIHAKDIKQIMFYLVDESLEDTKSKLSGVDVFVRRNVEPDVKKVSDPTTTKAISNKKAKGKKETAETAMDKTRQQSTPPVAATELLLRLGKDHYVGYME